MKNHPSSEEWMSFLYGESAPNRHAELDAHLNQCAVCRAQVNMWRSSMAALDTWKEVRPTRRTVAPSPAIRWAAAAAIVLGIGFGVGRLSTTAGPDVQQVQAAFRAEMDARLGAAREEFAVALQKQQTDITQAVQTIAADAATDEAGQLLSRFAKLMEERREADHESFAAAIKQIEEQHLSNYANLRHDLNTVAVNTDDEISQLVEMAALAKPTEP